MTPLEALPDGTCSACAAKAASQARLENLSSRLYNQELMSALFTQVYATMSKARGGSRAVRSEDYITADRVRQVVEQALRKAELDALDAWRVGARREEEDEG